MIRQEQARPDGARGFTLVEVLVAMVVAAVGLLGLAKMQALAVSATKESGSRALIALQAGSLASSMYANASYWASASAPASVSVAKGTGVVTDTAGTLSGSLTSSNYASGCTSLCTPAAMAANDLQVWALGLAQQFPTASATVACSATTAAKPTNCLVAIKWSEKVVSVTSNTAGGVGETSDQYFSLSVNP
jgi:type IV pilus assembly protein PilV